MPRPRLVLACPHAWYRARPYGFYQVICATLGRWLVVRERRISAATEDPAHLRCPLIPSLPGWRSIPRKGHRVLLHQLSRYTVYSVLHPPHLALSCCGTPRLCMYVHIAPAHPKKSDGLSSLSKSGIRAPYYSVHSVIAQQGLPLCSVQGPRRSANARCSRQSFDAPGPGHEKQCET